MAQQQRSLFTIPALAFTLRGLTFTVARQLASATLLLLRSIADPASSASGSRSVAVPKDQVAEKCPANRHDDPLNSTSSEILLEVTVRASGPAADLSLY